METIGYSDEYSTVDLLGGDKYYNGLAQFIMNCSTPMTISIQGDWGTGKSTALNIIEQKIMSLDGEKNHFIHFNTWQYSKFGLEDDISLILMQNFCEKLQELSKKKKSDNCDAVKKVIANISTLIVDATWGGKAGEVTEEVLKKFMGLENSLNKSKIVEDLKNQIEKCIKEFLNEEERIIILIDDLDRVSPVVAIELLEGMKNFLDCKQCVFVLAVDANVIYQGLKSKYGESFGEEKTKKYFDKIIQVPFNLPVTQYNLGKYIKQFLDENETNEEKYLNVIKNLLGGNPRGIKRAFNLLALYELIMSENIRNETDRLNLFAIILFQIKDELLYGNLVGAAKDSNESVVELLKQNEYSVLREALGIDLAFEAEDEDRDGESELDELAELLICTARITMRNASEGLLDNSKEKELPQVVRDIINRRKSGLTVDILNANAVIMTNETGNKYCKFNIDKESVNLVIYRTSAEDWNELSEELRRGSHCKIYKSGTHMTFVNIHNCTKEYLDEILTTFDII